MDFAGKNENRTPRWGTTPARSRPPPAESEEASEVRHEQETEHREVDLIASKLVYGSEPGLEITFRGLTGNVDIIVYRFINLVPGIL